ncbi:MAG TPA: amidohydrolase family protein [Gemmatimonadaceae bacterium]|nr:amidohydrolase family protein [Gemmatimonadaceae bacterium]
MRQFVSVNEPILALTNARVIDGTGAAMRSNQTIIIHDGRIEAVAPAASARIPAGAKIIDLAGHTVLPGQVGLHEHTYFGGVARVTQMSTAAPLLYLAFGVTTAMTAGSQLPSQEAAMARALAAGEIPGPKFYYAGAYLNGPAAPGAFWLSARTPDEARRNITALAKDGATWVKFLGEQSREVLRASIEHAHSLGLKVTGHLCSVTFSEAASFGIDLLQHGFITNSEYVPGKQPDVCPRGNMRAQADVDVTSTAIQASIRAIVAGKAAVASTLAAYETFSPDRMKLDPRALEFLAPGARREVERNHANIAATGLVVPERLLKKMMAWERAFVAAGGLLGAGCDPWGTGLLPGVGNLRNFELLIEAGFTTQQVVQIMTLNGARILGIADRTGSIEPGKAADIMIVRGNPGASPSDIYNVVTVFRDGVGYDSEKLRAAAKGRVGAN